VGSGARWSAASRGVDLPLWKILEPEASTLLDVDVKLPSEDDATADGLLPLAVASADNDRLCYPPIAAWINISQLLDADLTFRSLAYAEVVVYPKHLCVARRAASGGIAGLLALVVPVAFAGFEALDAATGELTLNLGSLTWLAEDKTAATLASSLLTAVPLYQLASAPLSPARAHLLWGQWISDPDAAAACDLAASNTVTALASSRLPSLISPLALAWMTGVCCSLCSPGSSWQGRSLWIDLRLPGGSGGDGESYVPICSHGERGTAELAGCRNGGVMSRET